MWHGMARLVPRHACLLRGAPRLLPLLTRIPTMRPLAGLLFLLALLTAAAPSAVAGIPNYRALLVGVSEYPHLKKDLSLDGPRNDVARMREVLVARGFPPQSIAVLADGVTGAELPTRARILAELEKLARTAKAGDYIVLLMAGHGSQQPVPVGSPYAADEPDGLFEIFLPRDVEGWGNKAGGSEGEVKNAIVDNEIRALVDRMTAAGAFVWGIFDSCHSATLVRSAGNSEVKLRQVTPADLGVPPEVLDRAVARASGAARAPAADRPRARSIGPNEGGAVFFYAAQTFEPTPEMRLPAGAPDRRSHGLFSFTIMQALEGGASMSYQQLAQQVLTRYGGMAEARATPLFSGTALQSGLLGQPFSSVRQWPVVAGAQLTLPAGALADIHEGAVFALLPTAVARDDQALGHVQVVKADATTAMLASVAHGGAPARSAADLKDGRIARLVQPALKFDFTVGVDLSACAQPCLFQEAIQRLKSPAAGAVPKAQVRWVDAGQTANLKLVAQGRRLWFTPPSMAASLACTTGDDKEKSACVERMEKTLVYLEAGSGATTDGLAAQLRPALHAASRASNLMRVATSLSSSTAAGQLKLTLHHVPAKGAESVILGANAPRLKPGDRVRIDLENTGRSALDVTVLYLDSKYGISVMYPHEAGASNRLEAGAKPQPIEIEITDSTFGTERLAVIAAEARRQGDRADYSFLAQPTLPSEVVTRGLRGDVSDAETGATNLFRDAGFAEFATRGARPSPPPSNTGMQVFSWQVVPQ